jgi:hypothetical protein
MLNTMAGSKTSWQLGSKKRQKEHRTRYVITRHVSVPEIYFPQLNNISYVFYHLSIMTLYFQSIKRLIH